MRVSQSSPVWSQGASEGRGTCDWPPRVVLKGSAVGAAQVELRGLIMHDHSVNVYGGVITTNGDTCLLIINATFTRNTAVRVAPAVAAAPRALLGLGGGRRWRRALTAAACGGACWARAARRVCGVLGWRGARRCGGACTARGPRAGRESTHAPGRGCRGGAFGGRAAARWGGCWGRCGLWGGWALGRWALVPAGMALAGRRGGGRGRWSGAAGLAQAAGLARRALLG